MSKKEKAIAICNLARSELIKELENKQKMVADREQLLQFEGHLAKIIRQLKNDDELPPRNQRAVWMGQVVVDSWPLDSKLGNLLCSAEQAYHDA